MAKQPGQYSASSEGVRTGLWAVLLVCDLESLQRLLV
jgi:hypothetical protein